MTHVDQLLARLREAAGRGYYRGHILIDDLERIITEWSKEQPAPVVDAWVPVSERLPTDDGFYIVTAHDGSVCMAGWYSDETAWAVITLTGVVEFTNVTHWMPLPAPPKGGTP